MMGPFRLKMWKKVMEIVNQIAYVLRMNQTYFKGVALLKVNKRSEVAISKHKQRKRNFNCARSLIQPRFKYFCALLTATIAKASQSRLTLQGEQVNDKTGFQRFL